MYLPYFSKVFFSDKRKSCTAVDILHDKNLSPLYSVLNIYSTSSIRARNELDFLLLTCLFFFIKLRQ